MKRLPSFIQKNATVLLCFAAALVLNFVIELMYRLSFSAVFSMIAARPLAFLECTWIIALCLLLCTFTKRKWFYAVLIGSGWFAIGVTNMVLLGYRVAPLSAIDFSILELDWSFVGIYVSVETCIVLIAAIILLVIGLVLLFRKCPKTPVQPLKSVVTFCSLLLIVVTVPELPTNLGFAGDSFKDVINMSEQYGFVYSFSRSLVDEGIDRPEDYSVRRVNTIADEIMNTEDLEVEDVPNVIFLQLESFYDVTHLKDVEFSEDPVPYFRELKEHCASGLFTAPSIGAGTANTEFEVLSQMDVHMFGMGEYPFKTILQEETCESLAYILKDYGLSAHAIHNNTATFYDRHIAYANMGFDTFTSVEYMNGVEYTEVGWAKDKVLLGEIDAVLDSTQERDFIYTISVQPHGAYPADSDAAAIKVLSGIEDEEFRAKMEYYATQLKEVDAFLRALTADLSEREEPTVLVLYGDHQPAFEIDASMLDAGNAYTTEYVIWANFPISNEDRDVHAFQLASQVFQKIGMNGGTLTKFHQLNHGSGAYSTELLTLQYDMLYGDRIVYYGETPFEPVDMQFGTEKIVLSAATVRADTLTAYGENFTPYSVICLNGEKQKTEFVSENEIRCVCEKLPEDAKVAVKQIAEDGTELSAASVQ